MHLIDDMTFDWQFQDATLPYDVERECKHVIQDRILPNIEQVLDDWDKANPGLRCVIPKLEIDVSCQDYSPDTIKALVLKQFKQQLLLKTKSVSASNTKNETQEVFVERVKADVSQHLYMYLKYGIVEDFKQITDLKQLLKSNSEISQFHYLKIIQLLSADDQAIKRLMNITEHQKELVDFLSKNEVFYTNRTFLAQFFQAIQNQWLPRTKSDLPIQMWKDMIANSTSLQKALETLFRILDAVLAFKSKTTDVQEFLLMILIKSYAQFLLHSNLKELAPIESYTVLKTQKKSSSFKENKDRKNLSKNEGERDSNDFDKEPKKDGSTLIDKNKTEEKVNQYQHDFETENSKGVIGLRTSNEDANEETFKKSSTQHFLMQNIGLFILHPFLKEFFISAKVLSEQKVIQPTKAVQLLHFLATGQDLAKDAELSLEKIIVGTSLQHVISAENPLSQEDKQLCEELLNAVLKHWSVLEKSGIETIRAMFLKRQGLVQFKEKTILIEAEHLAQDVLLNKLPWGLGMIKLPWIEHFIQITWKS